MDEKDVKILLVEDEESVASFVKTELEFEDYQVVWAEDGKKALDLFTQEKPTLILLDWMLPVYDGMTVLRRIRKQSDVPDTSLEFGPLKIDLLKHEFYCDTEQIYLTPKEFALITELMRDPEKVKSRDELLDTVWGYDFVGQTNTVDVYIRTIRNKIGNPYKKIIKTMRGLGYCLRKLDDNHEKS